MEQHNPSSSPRRALASRLFSYVLAVIAFASTGLLAPACGDNGGNTGGTAGTGGAGGSGTGGGACVGGVVVNGVCQGKCTPDKCLANNTCVGNQCELKCVSHTDCALNGSQNCAPAKEDDTGADITTCQSTGKPAGMGTACPFGAECANWLACPDNGTCFADQCGGDMMACVKDDAACAGDAACTIGKCPDGSGCRTDCAANCKPWLECLTHGEGDAEAFCTKRDCKSDDDCLGGFYCGILRDPHEICGSNPKKGNNNICGTTGEPCITLPDANSSRFEGSECMLRRTCLKRGQGVPCKTELDCSELPGQTCLDFAGETRCTRKCAITADCNPDDKCDTGLGACVPRYGKWTDPGKYCAPCVSDEDCGDKTTHFVCTELSGGVKTCFDESFPNMCVTDADCAKTPGGKTPHCLNENDGLAPGDMAYHRCYFPYNAATNKYSCW